MEGPSPGGALSSFRLCLVESQQALLLQLDQELEKVRQMDLPMDKLPSLPRNVQEPNGEPRALRSSKETTLQLPGFVEEPLGQGVKVKEAFSSLNEVDSKRRKHLPWIHKTAVASLSRQEQREAAQHAERYAVAGSFAQLSGEQAAKVVRKVALENFAQPETHESFFARLVRHPCFERLAMGMTMLNALWIPLDIEFNKVELSSEASPGFFVVENVFLLFFALELFVRYMAYARGCQAIRDPSFIFDGCLVLLMVVETWLVPLLSHLGGAPVGGSDVARSASVLRVARVLRILRTARLAKLVRYMPELVILLKGMIMAFRSVFFTLIFLVLVTLFFSVAISEVSDAGAAKDLFPSMASTLLRLLVQCVMPHQEDVFMETSAENWFIGVLWMCFILFASYIILGLLVGVLVETVSTVARIEREQLDVHFAQKVLWEMIDKGGADEDGDNRISEMEYVHLLSRPEAAKALTILGVDMTAALDYGVLLFEDGEPLSFAEFMEGILTLRGSNHTTVKDVVDLRKFTADEFSQMHEVLLEICKFLASQGMAASVVHSISENVKKSRATQLARLTRR